MNKIKKKQLGIVLFLLTMLMQNVYTTNGQVASAYWPLINYDRGITLDGNITAEGPLSIGCGYINYSSSNIFINQISGSLDPDRYLQFTIAPLIGHDLQVKELSSYIYTTTFNCYAQIRCSLSPDFADYQTIASHFNVTGEQILFTYSNLNLTVPDGSKLYIRVYTYSGNPYGHFRMADLTISGQTSSITSLAFEKDTFCIGEVSAEPILTGAEGGTFSASPQLSIDPETGIIDLTNSQPGNYIISYSISDETVASTDIDVLQSPDCNITGTDGPVYPSTTYTFSAPEEMADYEWSVTGNATIAGDQNAQTVTVEAGPSGGYSFTLSLAVQEENGCSSTCSKEINVEEPGPGILPTATLSGTQSICFGNSADLVVNLTGQAPWTFNWTDEVNVYTVTGTYDPQHVITVNPMHNTTYSLTGLVSDGNGNTNTCTGDARIYLSPITTAPEIIACPNNTIDVPITVRSFKEVRDISLTLKYDPGVMTYQGFENGDIAFGEEDIGDIMVSDHAYEGYRVIRIAKFSGGNLPSLEDDAELLRLKFVFIGGNTGLEWIDSPDDVWCSYSYLSEQDETGFETEVFCDIPTEMYYVNGSVKQLSVSGIDMNPIAGISTITGTPVIIPVSVTYPDLAAQEVSSEILTDVRISSDGTELFPAGARISKVTYNGIPVLSSPFYIGEKSEVLLSEILGTAANPLLGHSSQTVNWQFHVDGISSPINVPVKIEALAYTDLKECVIVLDTESFNISFADATLAVTESVTVCGTEPLKFTAEIGYPDINNLNTAIKADAKISATNAFPQGTVINWNYNNSTNVNYILTASTDEIMLSTIVGTLPNPLQGHSGTDVWSFEISNAGLMAGNEVTIEAVALLDNEYYIHSGDHLTLTVNPIPNVTAVSLLTSTDQSNWADVGGNLTDGYSMYTDPAEEYHYFDISELTSSIELNSDLEKNAFYLDESSVPTGFYEYWNARGVNASATGGWQLIMWKIINGLEPIFFISHDGTDYRLIDGLQYLNDNTSGSLRISGDYPAGSYSFSGTVTDVNGCISDVISVSLNLSSAPVITCPENITADNDAGNCGAVVTFTATATGSPAPDIVYTLSDGSQIESGYFFPVGTTTVTATASNSYKAVTCAFDVTVNDKEVPEINLLGNATVYVCQGETYVDAGTTATDNCDGDITASVTTDNPVNTAVPNIYTVTYNVTDAAGNPANEVSRTVIVHPIPDVTAVSLLTSTDQSNWADVGGNLTDGYSMYTDPAEEYHYFDISELTSSTELNSDLEKNAFYLDESSVPTGFYEYWNARGVNASATGGWQLIMWKIINGLEPMFFISHDGTDYRLIDGLQYLNDNTSGSLRISGDYPAGSYSFSGTVTDVNGCISDVISVSLNLSSAPVITCPENITADNDAGNCGAVVTFTATATGSPAPDIVYTLSDGSQIESGYFFPVGTTTVTATASNSYKAVTCTFDVTVIDVEAPVISCPESGNMDVIMNNAGTYVHNGTSWDASASDNCSEEDLISYTLSGTTTGTGTSLNGLAFNMGTTTVSWEAKDNAGNSNNCSFTVTVSGVNLTGTVKYYNKEETPLDDVIITLSEPLTDAVVATTKTDIYGAYSFASLSSGIYDVNIVTSKPMRSINSTDAGQVNAWNVAQSGNIWPSIEKIRFLAGNVNEDDFIESGDAGMIQNYFLSLGTEVVFDKSWEFWKTNDPISVQPQPDNVLQIEIPTEHSGIIQNFYGLVSGDFNRSNIPASGTMNSLVVKSARSDEGSITLLKGDTLLANANDVIELPIRAVSQMQVGAISLILNFPTEQLQIEDVFLKDNYNQSAGFNVIDNMLVIGWNSVNPIKLEAGEPLVTLRLKIIGKEQGLPAYFELAANPLNELADENMIAIDNAFLIMDGLIMKENVTGINAADRSVLMLTCYPNPFGENITIKYQLPGNGRVNLYVTGTLGNRIRIFSDQKQSAGEHLLDLKGTNLVPGVYYLTLRYTDQNGQSLVATVTLIKQ